MPIEHAELEKEIDRYLHGFSMRKMDRRLRREIRTGLVAKLQELLPEEPSPRLWVGVDPCDPSRVLIHSPEHEHDCEECVFLGRHDGADLYHCQRARPTLIARFGPGPDYISGFELVPFDDRMAEADLRLREKRDEGNRL